MPSGPRPGVAASRAPLPLLAALLAGSGFCGLALQVAWQREFRLVFGASTAASAAVLAIFMGGLGAGGLFFGPRADRHPRPLLLYATLEGAVGVLAFVTPPLLRLGRLLYIAAGGTQHLGQWGGTGARLAIAALVVLPATFLMGGTLPAASRAAEDEADEERGHLALIYGVNTLGAVAGGLAATFVFLEVLGTRRTIWVASLIEILVALIARAASRKAVASRNAGAPVPATSDAPREGGELKERAFVPLIAAGLVGFAFFLMELVWYRMLAPLFGGTVFAFGLILAAALVGIGLGGVIYSQVIAPRLRVAGLAGFAIITALEALCLLLPYGLGDRLATLVLALKPLSLFGFAGYLDRSAVICALVVVPAAAVSGVQFPWLVAMLGRGEEEVGRQVGAAYAFNTAGAVLGALAGGFGLMPWLSATGCWLFAGGCLALLGVACALSAMRDETQRTPALVALLLAATCGLLMQARGPTAYWRSSPIGIGRVSMAEGSGANELHRFANRERHSIVWARDGIESHVALQDRNGYAFIVNGKSDGNAVGDADTQVMGGLLGALLRPKASRAMVIGLGTGSTAGWLAAVPGISDVDVAELEPAILDVARASEAVNHGALENPKVHITFGDARELILTSRSHYDIVFSEPSNPYRAGIASLFSSDFYESVSRVLDEDGVFVQWVQGYEVDGETIRDIYATMGAVFPEVETWQTDDGDLLLVASHRPHPYDLADLRQRTAAEPFRSALRLAWHVNGAEGLFSHFVARPSFARKVAASGVEVSTDDRNLIEYGFARTMSGGRLGFDVEQVRQAARLDGEDRADAEGLDWSAVEQQRFALSFLGAGGPMPTGSASPGPFADRLRVFQLVAARDLRGALSLWQESHLEPLNLFEELAIGEALADGGDPSTPAFIDQHLADRPVEADALRARYWMNVNDPQKTVQAVERALLAFQTDPWAPTDLMTGMFRLAEHIAASSRVEAPRLLDLLRRPFAAGALEDVREGTRFEIAKRRPDPSTCQALGHEDEPDVPWQLDYLQWRRNCYAATADPLVEKAEADLAEFRSNMPAPFAPAVAAGPGGP